MKKYDFFFSSKAHAQLQKEGGTRYFWRGEEFNVLVQHGKEFEDRWGDLEYVGTGPEDEIESQDES